ncbi:hypothetical protein FD755_009838, partial [Muntiacus reevesi]
AALHCCVPTPPLGGFSCGARAPGMGGLGSWSYGALELKVELALTSDARTIVCYHPSVDIPYEHTKPIPRPDPVHNNEETHDLVLKSRLEEKSEHLEQGPMIEQLSKMFYTTKHRWYPRGQ